MCSFPLQHSLLSSPSSSRGGSTTSTSGYSSNENTLSHIHQQGNSEASGGSSATSPADGRSHSRPRAGSESSSGKGAVSKMMDIFRHRSHSAVSADDKLKAVSQVSTFAGAEHMPSASDLSRSASYPPSLSLVDGAEHMPSVPDLSRSASYPPFSVSRGRSRAHAQRARSFPKRKLSPLLCLSWTEPSTCPARPIFPEAQTHPLPLSCTDVGDHMPGAPDLSRNASASFFSD